MSGTYEIGKYKKKVKRNSKSNWIEVQMTLKRIEETDDYLDDFLVETMT